MRILKPLLPVTLIILISACENKMEDETCLINKDVITGYVQKGPFINGTSITISELDADLAPTGMNFNSQILDNKGTFELKNLELTSQFVELKANGFYFNEIKGEKSIAQLTLIALTDLTDSSSINVNVLSNLEKHRVEYLVSEGKTFNEAKSQAQQEILDIFEINKPDINSSEYLDISKEGDDNAILLATSLILQGIRNEAELTELLSNISTDIREDGILNAPSLGTYLINDIKLLTLTEVRNNIENRYLELEVDAVIPDFEKYVNQFIINTEFEFTKIIEYPEKGTYGPNLLSLSRLEYPSRTEHDSLCSLTAVLPEGTSLKIGFYPDLLPVDSTVFDTSATSYVYEYSDWGYHPQENSGWSRSDFNPTNCSREFYSSESDRIIELEFHLNQHGSAKIEIYENNSPLVNRIKLISW